MHKWMEDRGELPGGNYFLCIEMLKCCDRGEKRSPKKDGLFRVLNPSHILARLSLLATATFLCVKKTSQFHVQSHQLYLFIIACQQGIHCSIRTEQKNIQKWQLHPVILFNQLGYCGNTSLSVKRMIGRNP